MTDYRPAPEAGSLVLPYRPPYLWDKLLAFWAGRAIDGVEIVREGSYWRTIQLRNREGLLLKGWLKVENDADAAALRLTFSPELIPVRSQIESKARQAFDLDMDPASLVGPLSSMNAIKEGLFVPGARVPGAFTPFEMSVRAILGQQITVKAARTLAGRLARTYGDPVDTGLEGLTHLFPSPQRILDLGEDIADQLGPLGLTGRRSVTIGALAELILSNRIDLLSCENAESKLKELQKIPGIGPWTAHYIAMRSMKWPDAFPGTDYGVKKVLEPRSQKEIEALAESWRPWRAYAVINIWNSR